MASASPLESGVRRGLGFQTHEKRLRNKATNLLSEMKLETRGSGIRTLVCIISNVSMEWEPQNTILRLESGLRAWEVRWRQEQNHKTLDMKAKRAEINTNPHWRRPCRHLNEDSYLLPPLLLPNILRRVIK